MANKVERPDKSIMAPQSKMSQQTQRRNRQYKRRVSCGWGTSGYNCDAAAVQDARESKRNCPEKQNR
ncbi:hypothetical protein RUND412_006616 [Rhizina undulata]